ncbi:ABC transporter permease, partial [Klebsiella pneumoniae]
MRLFNRRSATLLTGSIITGALLAIALLSLLWTPPVPTKMHIVAKLKPPLTQGLLSTDHYGRDMLSLLMVGAWTSLSTAVMAVAIGATIGTLIGIFAAAQRGVVEALLMRLCDII